MVHACIYNRVPISADIVKVRCAVKMHARHPVISAIIAPSHRHRYAGDGRAPVLTVVVRVVDIVAAKATGGARPRLLGP